MTTSAEVIRGAPGAGGCVTVTRPADPRLRPLFARAPLGFMEDTDAFAEWLMPPTATVTIIINITGALGGLPPAFVAGVEDTYSLVRHGGTTCCLDLKLTPLGAYRILGVPMCELAGQVVDLGDVLGAEGRRLAAMLAEPPPAARPPSRPDDAAGWVDRFDLLDRFLLWRAATGPAPSRPVAWAWHRLVATGGLVPIGELAGAIGWSRRHLTERFRREVGLPPKTMARILRFSRLLGRAATTDPVRWDRLAVECGYYDQSHLNRDFREFAGTTPTDYLARLLPDGTVIGDGLRRTRASEAAAHG